MIDFIMIIIQYRYFDSHSGWGKKGIIVTPTLSARVQQSQPMDRPRNENISRLDFIIGPDSIPQRSKGFKGFGLFGLRGRRSHNRSGPSLLTVDKQAVSKGALASNIFDGEGSELGHASRNVAAAGQ